VPSDAEVSRSAAQTYYEDFALAVGRRDWLRPNLRHIQLKGMVDELLAGRSGLRILDVGCGAGVLTQHLSRYGSALGIDFSGPAIELARRLAPEASFRVASLEELPEGERFDVITVFDVMEHIPAAERPAFVAGLAARLDGDGLVVASTPHPAFTLHRRAIDDRSLQIIDEAVELADVVGEAESAGLQLLRYEAYDVFAGSPEYQLMVLTRRRAPGGPAVLRGPRGARLYHPARKALRRGTRVAHAVRLLRAGDRASAWWFLTTRTPKAES
jgi:2-polyprenyl-3-methyl-5-hydroxy-6-metoxy-1,4-benzoquinol methylase